MAPQYIILAVAFIDIGIGLANHGKPKEGTYSFWVSFFAQAVTLYILYWGGFFDGLF